VEAERETERAHEKWCGWNQRRGAEGDMEGESGGKGLRAGTDCCRDLGVGDVSTACLAARAACAGRGRALEHALRLGLPGSLHLLAFLRPRRNVEAGESAREGSGVNR
jgi:hypothetical protein